MSKPREVRHDARHLSGMSIAVKLALVTAGLVVVMMLAFSLTLKRFVTEAVAQQIRHAAHEAAAVAAAAPPEAWTEWFGTQFQGLDAAAIQAAAGAMKREEYDRAFSSPQVADQRLWNKDRLFRALKQGARIEALELLARQGDGLAVVASSYGAQSIEFNRVVGQEPLPVAEGEAWEGLLKLGTEERHVIRGSYPVTLSDGSAWGEFAVYISAAAVVQATKELEAEVVLFAGAFVFLGAAVAWGVGQWLMKPIRLLQEDVRIVAGGDLEHRTHAHTRDEIGGLAHRFDQMTQQLAAAAAAERETASSRHQMGVAAEVASSLFPARLPAVPGYDLAGFHESGGQLSGEYYDVLPLPGGRLGLLIGAASGTGVPAAMVMAMARSVLAALASKESDPGSILREANALLSGDLRRGMYVTVLLAVLDPQAGTLSLANAGHAPLLLCRGGKLAPVHSEGIALGFDKGPVFDSTLKVVRLPLHPGDRVVLYTPGITRVQDAQGQALGEERFVALVKREAGHPAQAFAVRLQALLKKFRAEAPPTEGVALLTLGRQAGGAA